MDLLSTSQAAGVSIADAMHLCELLMKVTQASDTVSLARTTCAGLRNLVGSDGVTFVIAEGDQVYYAEEDAAGQLWKGRRFPTTACISGWAITHKQAAVIEDIYADERIPQEAYRPTFVKSLAMVPVGADEPVASLGVYWSQHHRATEREMFLAESTAQAVHAAFLRCRQLARLQQSETTKSGSQTEARQTGDSRILSVVAHDLRNPLSAILQTAELLRLDSDIVNRSDLANQVRGSARRAARLVDQLHDYVRLQGEGLQMNLEDVSLQDVLHSVVDEVAPLYPEHKFTVSGEDVTGWWDRDRLLEAMANLLRNAAQHGAPQTPVALHVEAQPDEVLLRIHNDGDPITPALLPRLFDPFVRDKGRGQGLGLGLYIANQIAAAHGGELSVESVRNDGTTFTLRLPRGISTLKAESLQPTEASP